MIENKFIFDLDGTLCRFQGGPDFASSTFFADIRKNIFVFLEEKLRVPKGKVADEYIRIKQKYGEDISLAVEQEFGVGRHVYFEETWRLAPEKYIDQSNGVCEFLNSLRDRYAVLTNAPRVWAEPALRYLGVNDLPDELLFTGESDVRKPAEEAFRIVAYALKAPLERIYSIGDQEVTDIVPAQKVGMKTIRIGTGESVADYIVENVRGITKLGII